MNKIILKKNRGFTMVETLVAVAILMISIAGPLTIANKGLTAAIYAKDQMVASFLAQDAMEYIKNIRDNNVISGGGWLSNLSNCDETNKCTIDTSNGLISAGIGASCSGDECRLYDSGSSYTMSASGAKSKFNRDFYLKSVVADKESTVIVEVEWFNGTVGNRVTLQSEIFNILR